MNYESRMTKGWETRYSSLTTRFSPLVPLPLKRRMVDVNKAFCLIAKKREHKKKALC
jgi:hypothetical protein